MGSIRMIFGLLLIVAGLYVCWLLMPPYFSNYQFRDWVKEETTRDSYTPKSESDIRAAVLKKARELDIPLTEEGIQVQRSGMQYNGTVTILAPYIVHVDLPFYPLDLHFDASTENKGVF